MLGGGAGPSLENLFGGRDISDEGRPFANAIVEISQGRLPAGTKHYSNKHRFARRKRLRGGPSGKGFCGCSLPGVFVSSGEAAEYDNDTCELDHMDTDTPLDRDEARELALHQATIKDREAICDRAREAARAVAYSKLSVDNDQRNARKKILEATYATLLSQRSCRCGGDTCERAGRTISSIFLIIEGDISVSLQSSCPKNPIHATELGFVPAQPKASLVWSEGSNRNDDVFLDRTLLRFVQFERARGDRLSVRAFAEATRRLAVFASAANINATNAVDIDADDDEVGEAYRDADDVDEEMDDGLRAGVRAFERNIASALTYLRDYEREALKHLHHKLDASRSRFARAIPCPICATLAEQGKPIDVYWDAQKKLHHLALRTGAKVHPGFRTPMCNPTTAEADAFAESVAPDPKDPDPGPEGCHDGHRAGADPAKKDPAKNEDSRSPPRVRTFGSVLVCRHMVPLHFCWAKSKGETYGHVYFSVVELMRAGVKIGMLYVDVGCRIENARQRVIRELTRLGETDVVEKLKAMAIGTPPFHAYQHKFTCRLKFTVVSPYAPILVVLELGLPTGDVNEILFSITGRPSKLLRLMTLENQHDTLLEILEFAGANKVFRLTAFLTRAKARTLLLLNKHTDICKDIKKRVCEDNANDFAAAAAAWEDFVASAEAERARVMSKTPSKRAQLSQQSIEHKLISWWKAEWNLAYASAVDGVDTSGFAPPEPMVMARAGSLDKQDCTGVAAAARKAVGIPPLFDVVGKLGSLKAKEMDPEPALAIDTTTGGNYFLNPVSTLATLDTGHSLDALMQRVARFKAAHELMFKVEITTHQELIEIKLAVARECEEYFHTNPEGKEKENLTKMKSAAMKKVHAHLDSLRLICASSGCPAALKVPTEHIERVRAFLKNGCKPSGDDPAVDFELPWETHDDGRVIANVERLVLARRWLRSSKMIDRCKEELARLVEERTAFTQWLCKAKQSLDEVNCAMIGPEGERMLQLMKRDLHALVERVECDTKTEQKFFAKDAGGTLNVTMLARGSRFRAEAPREVHSGALSMLLFSRTLEPEQQFTLPEGFEVVTELLDDFKLQVDTRCKRMSRQTHVPNCKCARIMYKDTSVLNGWRGATVTRMYDEEHVQSKGNNYEVKFDKSGGVRDLMLTRPHYAKDPTSLGKLYVDEEEERSWVLLAARAPSAP